MTYRIFTIICYNDSENLQYNDIFNKIVSNHFTYFIINHSKDKSKSHYHISLYFKTPTTIEIVSKKLAIPSNYIKVKDETGNRYNLKKTIGYLIHYNNKEKHQYSFNDIITNDIDTAKKYYDLLNGGNNEKNELREILLFMENNNFNSRDLLTFCIENNLLKTFKKYSYFLSTIIKEYNYERRI